MATRDPNASWLYNVALGRDMPYRNQERLGDLVEAGLGLLYLANMFPSDMMPIIKDAKHVEET